MHEKRDINKDLLTYLLLLLISTTVTVLRDFYYVYWEYKKQVDENIPPVHPCRKIQFKLREKLTEELTRMEKLGLIKKMYEPTS